MDWRHREQARSPQGLAACLDGVGLRDPMWERACSRWRWVCWYRCWMGWRHRGQARSPQGLAACLDGVGLRDPVWERACSRWRWVCWPRCWMGWRLRGQARLPQGSVMCLNPRSSVGASLLAMAVGLLVSMLDGLVSSRASPAPTGVGGVSWGQKKRHLSVPFIYCRTLTYGLLPTISAVRRSSRFRL